MAVPAELKFVTQANAPTASTVTLNINNHAVGSFGILEFTKGTANEQTINLGSAIGGTTFWANEDQTTSVTLPAGAVGDVHYIPFTVFESNKIRLVTSRFDDIANALGTSTTSPASQALAKMIYDIGFREGGNAYGAVTSLGHTANFNVQLIANNIISGFIMASRGLRSRGNSTATSVAFDAVNASGSGNLVFQVLDNGNWVLGAVGSGTTPGFGAGTGIGFLPNATAIPTSNPSSGLFIYASGGTLFVRRSDGTVNTIGIVPDTISAGTVIGNAGGGTGSPQEVPMTNLWNNTLQMLGHNLDGLQQVFDTSFHADTANVTVANTTTETTLFSTALSGLSNTIPAYWAKIGSLIRTEIDGVISTLGAAAGNLTIRVKLGSTTISTITITGIDTGLANADFNIESKIRFRTLGSTGTVVQSARMAIVSGTTRKFYSSTATGTVTIDTNSDQLLTVTAQWSVADAANTMTSIITDGGVKLG